MVLFVLLIFQSFRLLMKLCPAHRKNPSSLPEIFSKKIFVVTPSLTLLFTVKIPNSKKIIYVSIWISAFVTCTFDRRNGFLLQEGSAGLYFPAVYRVWIQGVSSQLCSMYLYLTNAYTDKCRNKESWLSKD